MNARKPSVACSFIYYAHHSTQKKREHLISPVCIWIVFFFSYFQYFIYKYCICMNVNVPILCRVEQIPSFQHTFPTIKVSPKIWNTTNMVRESLTVYCAFIFSGFGLLTRIRIKLIHIIWLSCRQIQMTHSSLFNTLDEINHSNKTENWWSCVHLPWTIGMYSHVMHRHSQWIR